MILTPTDFTGIIPNIDKDEVSSELVKLIAEKEPEFLVKSLGYSLYSELQAGLSVDPLEEKWNKLVFGYNEWPGLVESGSIGGTYLNGYEYKKPVLIQFGVTNNFTANTSSVTVADWQGWEVVIEKIGFGTQKPGIDYTYNISSGTWVSLNGIFNQNEFFYINFIPRQKSSPIISGIKRSVIIDYIFFYWLRNNATQTTSIGEFIPSAENGTRISPEQKQVLFWNRMVDNVRLLHKYLYDNVSIYGSYTCHKELLTKLNLFGI